MPAAFASGRARFEPDFRPGRANRVAQPVAGAVPVRFRRGQRAGVPFEKGHVRAEAADRQLDGDRAAPAHGGERLANQR